jgi:imidazolonepropionase-like amidohydrolase
MDAALDDVAGSLLAGGVTTVRDLGAFGTSVLRLRDRIAAGAVAGPRILASGLIISAVCPGAKTFPGMYLESTGPDTFRAAVRRVVGDDADVIKIMATGAFTVADEDIDPPQMSLEELRAAVHEGHRLGRRVAVHAEGLAGVRLAVQAGADTIEHAETAHRDPGVLEAMARERIILVPTLSAFEGVAANPVYADWMRERSAALSAEAGATVAAARAAGVRIAVGPDSGPQGQNGQEVARLVAAGLTPLEAIAAGTSIAAEACGLGDRTGRIAPRFDADLIVVDGDPIAAPELLAGNPGPWLVILGGKVVAGSSQGAARLPHM